MNASKPERAGAGRVEPGGGAVKPEESDPALVRLVLPLAKKFWLVLAAVAVITIVLGAGLSKLIMRNDLMFMIPEDNQVKNVFETAESRYGNSIGLVIAVHSPQGIYQPDFLKKIKTLCSQVLLLNNKILAAKIQDVAPLDPAQAQLLAAYMQSRLSDPDFSMEDLAEDLEDPEEMAEAMADQAPDHLQGRDMEELGSQVAARLGKAVKEEPGVLARLGAVFLEPTDRLGKVRALWVDQLVSLSETDTAWPEFRDRSGPMAVLGRLGVEPGPGADALLDEVLERGLKSGPEIISLLKAAGPELIQSGVPESLLSLLRGGLDMDSARDLAGAVVSAPKQIRVAELLQAGPKGELSPAQVNRLRLRLRMWPFFDKGLRSDDEKSTLVMVRTAPNLNKANRSILLEQVKPILAGLFPKGRCRIYLAGEPVIDDDAGRLIVKDVKRLLPIVVAVVAVFLALSFRSLTGVAFPLLTVLLSVVWCLGAMGYAGAPMSIVSTVLPILLVAVGSAYGIHLMHNFRQASAVAASPAEAARSTLAVTGRGVLMAGLTTIAGFASLGFNEVVPLRDFGIFIGIGVFFALVISLYLITSLMIRFAGPGKKGAGRNQSQAGDPAGDPAGKGALGAASMFCIKRPWLVITAFALALALAGVGISKLKVEVNSVTFFKKDEPVRVSNDFINRHFAGTVGIRTVLTAKEQNGVLDPEVLGAVQDLSSELVRRHPEVGKVMSVVDLIKKMNQTFFYNDAAYYRLPAMEDLAGEKSLAALKGQYAFYVDKFDRKQIRSFIDQEKRALAVTIQVNDASSLVAQRIMRDVDNLLAGPLGEPLRQRGISHYTTGIGALYDEVDGMIVNGQLWSIAGSLAIVLALVSLVMRSFVLGLLSIVPLSATLLINFGVMGFAGIPLDTGTAITACVAIGIGIDYAIHYLNRYRLARERGLGHVDAATDTAFGAGGAILINALAVAAGFGVLTLSSFAPLVNLGLLISLTMINAALGSLTLVPALLTLSSGKAYKAGDVVLNQNSAEEAKA